MSAVKGIRVPAAGTRNTVSRREKLKIIGTVIKRIAAVVGVLATTTAGALAVSFKDDKENEWDVVREMAESIHEVAKESAEEVEKGKKLKKEIEIAINAWNINRNTVTIIEI